MVIAPASLRRSAATCTSSVLVGPNQFASQTASMICSRDISAPGSSVRKASRSYSLGASATSWPSSRTRAALRSMVSREPYRSGMLSGDDGVRGCTRRITARIRAMTSRTPNGLDT